MVDKKEVYFGIDPGSKGAICALLPITNKTAFMSTTEHPAKIIAWIEDFKKAYNVRVIFIEDVHAIQGTSAGSNFSFGYNVGVVNTIAIASQVMVDRVTPKKWQKFVGVKEKGPAIKKEVAEIALRLYPDAKLFGPKGGLLDGRSDSLMIAHYAAYHR